MLPTGETIGYKLNIIEDANIEDLKEKQEGGMRAVIRDAQEVLVIAVMSKKEKFCVRI